MFDIVGGYYTPKRIDYVYNLVKEHPYKFYIWQSGCDGTRYLRSDERSLTFGMEYDEAPLFSFRIYGPTTLKDIEHLSNLLHGKVSYFLEVTDPQDNLTYYHWQWPHEDDYPKDYKEKTEQKS